MERYLRSLMDMLSSARATERTALLTYGTNSTIVQRPNPKVGG